MSEDFVRPKRTIVYIVSNVGSTIPNNDRCYNMI